MDWYLFAVAFVVAAVAMSTGLSGALLLSAVFIPVMRMDPHVAFGVALMTQAGGFLSGLAAYWARRQIDLRFGAPLLLVAIPVAVVSVWVCQALPADALEKLLGAFLLSLSLLLIVLAVRERLTRPIGTGSGRSAPPLAGGPEVLARFQRLGGRFWVAGVGGMFLGLTSAGLGEILVPYMIRIRRMEWANAVGTAVFVVFGTTLAASGAHVASYLSMGQLGEVARILPYTVPGAVLGAQVGPQIARLGGARLLGPLFAIGCALMGLTILAGSGH